MRSAMSELKSVFDNANADKKDSGEISPEAQKKADFEEAENKRGVYLWLRTPHPSFKN